MAKRYVQMLIAMATLAVFSSVMYADDVLSDIERLPPLQQPANASGSVQAPIQAPAKAGEEELPAAKIVPGGSPFVDDGWKAISLSDCCKPTCSGSEAIDDCCKTCDSEAGSRKITADVELMALRTHFGEEALGKLGERYELSERIVVGVENCNGIGGRIRYWSYDRTTPNLQGGSNLRADFDVIDFEGTTRFSTQSFDLLVAGGIRWADIKIDIDQGRCRNDMPGGTFALDLRGLICCDCENGLVWHSVSGARWSIFGGDWECSNGLIGPTRDDNITVTEIYGGVECSHCVRGHEIYARLVFEAQNWRSDALGEATDVDSIGFIGPGLNLGMNF